MLKQWLHSTGPTLRRYPMSKGKGEAPARWFSSVQFSCSVVSDFLRPHESQHARPPCPSPTSGVHSDGRRGEFTFRIKPHSHQRCSEGSDKPCAHQDPETQRETELCLSVSCGRIGQQWTAAGQGLWVQQTWVWHKPSWRRSPLTPPQRCQNLHRTGR